MFLIDSKNKIRLPTLTTMISSLSDPSMLNPENADGGYKLVAPRSHLHIVDRNTMDIVKTVPLNFKDLTPYDIYSDIVGKRYVGLVVPQTGQPCVINAFQNDKLDIYHFLQPYKIHKKRLYINDLNYTQNPTGNVITFERIKFNKINSIIQLSLNGNERKVITETAESLEKRDQNLYIAIGLGVQRFGELRIMGINRYIYTTSVLSGQRYDIRTDYVGLDQPDLIKVINNLAPTLNTISEIEKLSIIMDGRIPQGYADLSHSLFSMSLPALATLSLVTRIHYEHKVEDIPAKLSDEMLEELRTDKVLGRYLSKTLARKAYRLVRRLRINYLEGLVK